VVALSIDGPIPVFCGARDGDIFGAGDRWAAVQSVMLALEQGYGIFLTDINPGNITFGDVG